jgi:hypothetical protein
MILTTQQGIRMAVILALLFGARPGWAASLSLTEKGIQADAGNMGQFTISFPNLLSSD